MVHGTLRRDGLSQGEATNRLRGKSVGQKNELLFQYGVNFNKIPSWQKRGVGLYWETFQKTAINPLTNQDVVADRRRIRKEIDLPMKAEYSEFIRSLVTQRQGAS